MRFIWGLGESSGESNKIIIFSHLFHRYHFSYLGAYQVIIITSVWQRGSLHIDIIMILFGYLSGSLG